MMSDAINPDHYKRLPAEAIEIIEAAIENAPSKRGAFLHGQVLKYILRCWHKNGIEDLRKAKWYLDRLIDSFDESEPEQPKPTLNSDKLPEGYRKLNDSSEEPRQLGDLRWSVAAKRYVEISGDEIGYANRDNWAACRKITGEVAVEGTGEVKPPDGWRWLEVGEVFRKGDTTNTIEPIPEHWVGTQCVVKHVALRRNRFEVGEKVIDCRSGVVFTVQHFNKTHKIVFVDGVPDGIESKHFAPYIEESK